MTKEKKSKLLPGVYRHYKGHEYSVIDVAEHTETSDILAVYHSHEGKHWARPIDNFLATVEVEGEQVPRFQFVSELQNEFKDKYLRTLADNQNLLRQTAKEKEDFRLFAQSRFIEQILPVYDNFKLAMVHTAGEKSSWIQGVEYVVKQFKEVLNQFGVVEIESSGKIFNHDEMEAIDEEITKDTKLEGCVAKQVTAGYKLNGRVMQAARVIVYRLDNKTS
jgi:molecular chaperone GrpE